MIDSILLPGKELKSMAMILDLKSILMIEFLLIQELHLLILNLRYISNKIFIAKVLLVQL